MILVKIPMRSELVIQFAHPAYRMAERFELSHLTATLTATGCEFATSRPSKQHPSALPPRAVVRE